MADQQLVYVTLDLRRALWVSEITGAKIVCAYKSDLLANMRKQGADIWCFQEAYPKTEVPTSSFRLLSHAKTLKVLQDMKKPLQFLIFKPSSKIKKWIETQKWELLSSDIATSKRLEDKLDFAELAVEAGVLMPEYKEVLWNLEGVQEWHEDFGETFIVQGRMGHAGSSSFVKRKGENIALQSGTRVKISKLVTGDTYTLNGYVDAAGNIATGPLWKQLMNVEDWNSAELGTVGISAVNREELDHIDISRLKNKIEKLRLVFIRVGYTGSFGLDLIWSSELWYMIECNARLTASVSLQVKQDQISGRQPLLGLHAKRSILNSDEFRLEQNIAEYSQVILRNTRKRTWKTPRFLKSGLYQLNDQREWVLKSRSSNLADLQEGEMLLLLSRAPQSFIQSGSDYATVMTKGPLHTKYEVLKEEIRDFYERVVLGHIVRNKDLWDDRYARLMKKGKDPVFILQRPVPDYKKAEEKILRKYRQVEVLDGEVLQMKTKYHHFVLVEKVDGTRGWLHESHRLNEGIHAKEFVYPGKLTRKADAFLKSWKGTPYLWGGNTKNGIDCSAFVQRYFWEVKGRLLPKYSQDQKAESLKKENIVEMADEDLLFMKSRKKGIAHVGIIKNGKVWHSSLETGVVEQTIEELQEKYEIEHLSHLDGENLGL